MSAIATLARVDLDSLGEDDPDELEKAVAQVSTMLRQLEETDEDPEAVDYAEELLASLRKRLASAMAERARIEDEDAARDERELTRCFLPGRRVA